MSRRAGPDPEDSETKEFEKSETPAEGTEPEAASSDDPTRLDEIPVVEESSIREDPLGEEAAAAAWAAGATPPPDLIPDDERESRGDIGIPGRRKGLEPFAPGAVASGAGSEPLDSGAGQEPAPDAESRDPSLENKVWRDEGVALPGAEVPLVTPGHVGESTPSPAAQDESPQQGVPSSDRFITERGHTIISPKVVEKIAGRAASEVDGVGGVHASGLGRFADLLSASDKRETQAHAEVDRASTAVDLVVSVRYPEPVGVVATRVRQHVIERLHELTGLEVGEVNVSIPELVAPSAPPPRPRVI